MPPYGVWRLNLLEDLLMCVHFPSLESLLAKGMVGGREAQRGPSAELAGNRVICPAPAEPKVT